MLIAFDLLHLDGEDWRQRAFEERREALARLLPVNLPGIVLNESITGDGPTRF